MTNNLINGRVGESVRIEYKRNCNPEMILHTICAFANELGWWIYHYRIEEENCMPKFPIDGLKNESINRINKELLRKCNLIEPRYIR